MAKQQKKTPARRVPHASEPRMYGDGKPSQPAESAQTPAAPRPVATPTRSPATPARQPAAPTRAPRTAGLTPRGSGASGSFGRVDRITDYTYVMKDLRRLGITAAVIMGVLIILGIIVP